MVGKVSRNTGALKSMVGKVSKNTGIFSWPYKYWLKRKKEGGCALYINKNYIWSIRVLLINKTITAISSNTCVGKLTNCKHTVSRAGYSPLPPFLSQIWWYSSCLSFIWSSTAVAAGTGDCCVIVYRIGTSLSTRARRGGCWRVKSP